MPALPLGEYVQLLLKNGLLADDTTPALDLTRTVSSLTCDSRAAVPGSLFICKGAAFKKEYLAQALSRGALLTVVVILLRLLCRAARLGPEPQVGHFAKSGITPLRYLREMRVADASAYQTGQELKVDIFAAGEKVDVEGTSKGKGFAGTIKRWHFHQGPMSHGSKNHRRPASSGAKGPARTFKGKHAPGQMGGNRVTVQNLEIVRVDVERNLLLVKGAVPGPKNGLVLVRKQ